MTGKPGISSFDKFAIGGAIKSELRTMAGNLFGLNTAIMKLSNGDDETSASLDPVIGTRTVHKVAARKIGNTVSSASGGLGPMSTPARSANILGNPYMRRYEAPGANRSYNLGLAGSPMIGEYYDVYESEAHRVRFLDDTIGRDLMGYTHLENAAIERSGDLTNDELYLRGTYSVFGNLMYPFDNQDIEAFRYGPKRYSPAEPYALKPLENSLTRRALNGDVQGFKEKFEAFLPERGPYRGSLLDMWEYMGSHVYLNLLNGVEEHGLYVENYEFEPRNRSMVFDRDAVPQSDYAYFLDVDTISPEKEIKGLLGKTNRMFYEGKIKSLVNRFATLNGNNEGSPGFLNTATDHVYGLSRGRNLRKVNLTNENGYPNPYCRVWTTHYQYSKYKHLIRGKWADDGMNAGTEHYTLNREDQLMRPNKGYDRLKSMTSMDPENGRPIFAPYYVNDRSVMEKDSIKRCMFSIENLAWKDIIPDSTLIRKDGDEKTGSAEFLPGIIGTRTVGNAHGFGQTLTPEQRGPNGGRIMWFPPYNLKFNEQAHARWNENEFIGRGEKIYSYVNSERTGTLSFTILVDHPSIINEWARGGKMGKTAGKTDPLSKDEAILRFFAGCDALEFNPRKEYDVPYEKFRIDYTTVHRQSGETPVGTLQEPDGTDQITDTIANDEGEITFYSIFYYPNDYSAEDFNTGKKAGGAVAGLNEMFEKGDRNNGTKGYELGQGGTGMTYSGSYYIKAKDKNGDQKEWYYPVDTRVNDEVLRNKNRYKDMQDFGLNTSFYGDFWKDVPDKENIMEYLNTGNESISNSPDLEQAKSLVGVTGTDNKYFIPSYYFYKNLKDVITKLDAATDNRYTYEFNIQGFASSHGYSKSNVTLAENRARVIEGWIRSLGVFNFEDGTDKISHNGNGQINDTGTETESDFKPKAARAAVVTLTLKPSATKTVITEVQRYKEVPVYSSWTNTWEEEHTMSWEKYDTSKSDDYNNDTYDDEYAYFKQINERDDMVKRYISDKVDYFDPAYHSITPEGFNARLTFLHQCLRQGPTISASDLGTGGRYGAGNLSFGRAPFCVLRIGDFYNTKICIQNINIEYDNDGVQWDLNPEGIGLQPMLANVNITFTFLGGSDLSGPIARLQNAASYNYYANTSVYDRRADYRDTFVSPENDEAMTWSPLILNPDDKTQMDRNVIEHRPFYTRHPKDNNTNKD